ncbi:MAG: METTL5 family protein [Thermoplasmatota archaeon]
MRKRHLEMALSNLPALEGPDPALEQYATPVEISSNILWSALENGDILDRTVLELGCGGGPFALGALMLGASSAAGIDIDPRCIELAERNLHDLVRAGLIADPESCSFMLGDAGDTGTGIPDADTVFMNPPFGAQTRHADRDFIRTACRKGSVIYSIHNGGTGKFVRSEFERNGAASIEMTSSLMPIPHMFHFHSHERTSIDILLVRVTMCDPSTTCDHPP